MSNGSRLIWPSAITNMCDRNMTNLWLWIAFAILENFRESIPFILLGNVASSLKFELISRKIGLDFYSRWNLMRVNFFVARDCNYRDEKLWDVSKADCIARDYILLSKLRSSWRFLKFSEALRVYSNWNFYVHNHVSQKAKGKISNWDAIRNRKTAFQVQEMFSAKQHPDCRHQWPEIQLL